MLIEKLLCTNQNAPYKLKLNDDKRIQTYLGKFLYLLGYYATGEFTYLSTAWSQKFIIVPVDDDLKKKHT